MSDTDHQRLATLQRGPRRPIRVVQLTQALSLTLVRPAAASSGHVPVSDTKTCPAAGRRRRIDRAYALSMRMFLLARHGQSLFNVAGIVNGDPSLDRGLSEQGIEEARRLGGQIESVAIDLLATSPFPRVLQTASLALGARDVPHIVDGDLGDVRIGELEGRTLDDYRAQPAHADPTLRFPGGESLNEAARRYAAAFERLLARDEHVTLVVCHEIPVRYAVNAAAAGSAGLNGPLHDVANAAPYVFDEAALRRAADRIRELATPPG